MIIRCVHCGGRIAIHSGQLGGRIVCPHCGQTIGLPAAGRPGGSTPETERPSPGQWLTSWVPPLVSLIVHMLLFLVLALVRWGSDIENQPGEEVQIGRLPRLELRSLDDASLEMVTQEPARDPSPEPALEELAVAPPAAVSADQAGEGLPIGPLAPAMGGDGGAFDVGAVRIGGGGSGGGGGWDGMLRRLRQHGLDIVIVFDSTSSMGGEINQVKAQIYRIGTALHRLVPKTQIGMCTYRDASDAYVVRGLPLTDDLSRIDRFLAGVSAGGGGDREEAVQAGLEWAVRHNDFRPDARKVILLFGDAPPHRQDLQACLRTAADFHNAQEGIVSTVTCRSPVCLPEFVQIAEMGGGEAFLTADQQQIMTQLMVLVFGSRYRSKVVEALNLIQP
jgi:hypothetical protein